MNAAEVVELEQTHKSLHRFCYGLINDQFVIYNEQYELTQSITNKDRNACETLSRINGAM